MGAAFLLELPVAYRLQFYILRRLTPLSYRDHLVNIANHVFSGTGRNPAPTRALLGVTGIADLCRKCASTSPTDAARRHVLDTGALMLLRHMTTRSPSTPLP